MTDGTSQGLFIVVAIVIFGIFTLTAYILFEDTLSPALASMFTDAIEKSDNQLNKEEKPLTNEQWVKKMENLGYVMATDDDFTIDSNGNPRYTGTEKKVIIPHEIKGKNVTSYENMFRETLSGGIKSLPVLGVASNNPNIIDMNGMFEDSQATELDISGIDTSNVTSMRKLFYRSNAQKIKGLENLNTSNVTDTSYMFSRSQVKEVDVSNFDTSNVTNMSGMFSRSEVKELDVSNFDTSNVTSMSGMFYRTKTKELDVSNFDTSNVTDTSDMFKRSQVAEIKGLENLNTSNVTNMSGMFYRSPAKELDVSKFDTSNVTDMHRMFYGSEATELDLSNFDTSNVTDTSDMFYRSQATTVYARTQVDADKYNASINKPNGLQVIVKQ